MSATEAFGLAMSLAVLVYLLYALFRGEKLMSAISVGQIVFYAVVLIALGLPLGLYMARVYSARGRLLHPPLRSRRRRARLLQAHPHRPDARAGLEELCEDGRSSSARSSRSSSTGCCAFRAGSS